MERWVVANLKTPNASGGGVTVRAPGTASDESAAGDRGVGGGPSS